jgi:hypothetical protein
MAKKKQNLVQKVISNDVVIRAFKTFVQAFVAVLLLTNEPFTTTALVGAGSAGLSAAWNSIKEYRK